MFFEKELQKTNQNRVWSSGVKNRKDNNLYVKWKGSFNSWIDKKDIV